MKLSDIFTQLITGSMVNISGVTDKNQMPTNMYPRYIGYINLALSDLHVRFLLKKGRVVIRETEGVTNYPMLPEYALSSDDDATVKFIMDDLFDPFIGDISRIESIVDEEGLPVPLNDINNPESIYYTGNNVIRIDEPTDGRLLTIVYRAKNVHIPLDSIDPEDVVIDLPNEFLDALILYVTSRIYAGRNDAESMSKSMAYLQQYGATCALLTDAGLLDTKDNTVEDTVYDKGWV